MQASQIQNYTNPRAIYNTPLFAAMHLGVRISKWGIHNFKHWIAPPIIHNIQLLPVSTPNESDETFEVSMFTEKGFLHEVPLNHFISLSPAFKPQETFMVNAGYLLHHFIISDDLGFKELKRLLANAKKETKATLESKGNNKF